MSKTIKLHCENLELVDEKDENMMRFFKLGKTDNAKNDILHRGVNLTPL